MCPSLCGERCPQTCKECNWGNIESHSQIALNCDHTFGLEYLDRHTRLQDVYAIGNQGSITSLSLSKGSISTPNCPTCLAPIKDVRRYSVITQVKNLSDNVDRMIAKMGRKLNMFDDWLCCRERELEAEFASFCNKIRPNPMAAKANQRMVWERGNSFMEVQAKVTNFRGMNVIGNCREIVLRLDWTD